MKYLFGRLEMVCLFMFLCSGKSRSSSSLRSSSIERLALPGKTGDDMAC